MTLDTKDSGLASANYFIYIKFRFNNVNISFRILSNLEKHTKNNESPTDKLRTDRVINHV